jgi:cold shock CspA family protein
MVTLKPKKFFGHGSVQTLTDKGFGFIATKIFEKNLFFHANEVKNDFEDVCLGDEVSFDIIEQGKGSSAINVTRNLDLLNQEQEDSGAIEENSEVRILVNSLAKGLISAVAKNPRALDEIEWRDIERLLAEAISGLGIEVELTPGSKDGGRDLVLVIEKGGRNTTVLVEIKHWRSNKTVGIGPVSEFLHVISNESSSGGVFLSTSGFSKNIVEHLTEFERKKIGLGSEEKVVSLCRNYIKAQEGNWYPPDDLFKVIYEDTNLLFDEQ